MADIKKELNAIKNAVYGKEVRGSIHDGIKKINDEVENATDLSESAKHQVENIQQQVNQLVIEGDSSVEAAQARVDADGNVFTTLKERLDTKETQFANEIGILNKKTDGIVNVKEFGAKGDGVTDDTEAIQAAIDAAAGGVVLLPKPTAKYRITSTLYVKNSYTQVIGFGDPTIYWDGPVGGIPLKVDCSVYNNNNTYTHIRLEGFKIDGGGKALWTIWLNGFTSRCEIKNVYLTNAVGALYAKDCWYSSYQDVFIWSLVDGLPSGLSLSSWQSVYNNQYTAPITFINANSVSIRGLHVARFGVSNIPLGGSLPNQAVYISGHNTSMSDVSFESTNGSTTKTIALRRLIFLDYGSNTVIRNVYSEEIHTQMLLETGSYYIGCLRIENFFTTNSTIGVRHFNITKGINAEIDGVLTIQTTLASNDHVVVYSADRDNTKLRLANVCVWEGNIVNIGGVNYADSGVAGQLGARATNTTTTVYKLPTVVSGLTVTQGLDGVSSYVLVSPGSITDELGGTVSIGYNTFSPNVGRIGYLLRPAATAATWNVCVDTRGCVFLENTSSPRSHANQGKLILATFTTDSRGNISGLTRLTNNLKGYYANGTNNKVIYGTAPPASGTWAVGDVVYNTNPTAGGYIGWVCVSGGTPGTWKGFGLIQI